MSIEAVTWDEAYGGLAQMQYRFPGRVRQDVEQLRRVFSDLEPYVAELPTGEVLLLAKGTLLRSPNGAPPVTFVVTLQPPFPNSYPILTIEEPPAPWRFANHPNVDSSGQTYLSTVTNWNPQNSTIFMCVNELKDCLSRLPPFENTANAQVAARPPPPPAQPLPPPRAQPVPVVQPQPVQQQRVVYQQQQQQRPVYVQQQTQGDADLEAMRAVARGTLAVAGSAMGLLGMGARVLAGESPTQMVAKRAVGALWQPPQPRGTPAQQRQERMKQDFVLLLTGKLNVPPGTEVTTPDGFCIGRFMTSRSAIDDGLLAPGAAPLPLPPCPDPTPADAVELAKQKQHDDRERAAAASAADTTSGAGWKALSAVGRFAGKVGSTMKNKVEDKVRERYASEDLAKFSVDFPAESQSERLIIEYSCYCLSGDAVARKGRLYLAERSLLFSGGIESTAPSDPSQPPPAPLPFKFVVPLRRVVCLLRGECIGKRFLHVLVDDGTFRCFTDFSASVAGKVGSIVSSSMAGTDAYDRCYNWLDHAWRAATPVPSPSYVYAGQPGPLMNQPGYVPPSLQPLSVLRQRDTAGSTGYVANPPPPAAASGKVSPPPATATPMPAGYNNARPQQEADLLPQAAASESTQCVVCLEAQKNAFFQPCGHVCCCMKCANGVGACPLCRAKILQVFPAYI